MKGGPVGTIRSGRVRPSAVRPVGGGPAVPLLDHFHPPLHPRHHGESFHSDWATRIADALNERWLPPEFLAEEYTHAGSRLEIDVATHERSPGGNGPAVAVAPAYAPPKPARVLPAVFPDSFEVRVFATAAGLTL